MIQKFRSLMENFIPMPPVYFHVGGLKPAKFLKHITNFAITICRKPAKLNHAKSSSEKILCCIGIFRFNLHFLVQTRRSSVVFVLIWPVYNLLCTFKKMFKYWLVITSGIKLQRDVLSFLSSKFTSESRPRQFL